MISTVWMAMFFKKFISRAINYNSGIHQNAMCKMLVSFVLIIVDAMILGTFGINPDSALENAETTK
jgi:tryptophan-rich sensory protein